MEINHFIPNSPCFLVALQTDLRSTIRSELNSNDKFLNSISSSEGEQLAKQLKLPYFETSALTGKGIRDLMDAALRSLQKELISDVSDDNRCSTM